MVKMMPHLRLRPQFQKRRDKRLTMGHGREGDRDCRALRNTKGKIRSRVAAAVGLKQIQ